MLFIFTTYINNINQKKSTQKGAFCVFAQLPNIIGSVERNIVDNVTSVYSGVLAVTSPEVVMKFDNGGNTMKRTTLQFNASSSNSIYTDSGKVYSLSLALNFIIKS